jgi:hypothetical protein
MALLINPYRFSGFDPASLFAGGTYKGFWIDASDTSTLKQQDTGGSTAVTADGDPVGYVANKYTTTGGALTRITDDTCRPLYKVVSGYSCLQFDGSNDQINGDATACTIPSGDQTYWTIVAVAALASSGVSFNDMLWAITGSNASVNYFQYVTGGQVGGSQANHYTVVQSITQTNKNVFTIRIRSDGSQPFINLRVNGTQLEEGGTATTSAKLGSGNAVSFEIGGYGGGSYFKGDLYQFYIINRDVSGADLTSLERALGAKAGVTI